MGKNEDPISPRQETGSCSKLGNEFSFFNITNIAPLAGSVSPKELDFTGDDTLGGLKHALENVRVPEMDWRDIESDSEDSVLTNIGLRPVRKHRAGPCTKTSDWSNPSIFSNKTCFKFTV